METLESLQGMPTHYDSYLLRTWRPARGGKRCWMLENVRTGARHTFTELPELVLFLRDHTHEHSEPARHRTGPASVLPPLPPASSEEQP